MVQAASKQLAMVAQLRLSARLIRTIVWESIAHPLCETRVAVHDGVITTERRSINYGEAFASWASRRIPVLGIKA
jgi:hypothetical protein